LSYFFSGVLATGGVAGLALVSGFLSTGFLSSVFFSSFTGLAVGLTVTDGDEVTAGEAATTGVEVGVVTVGFVLFVLAEGWQALPIAVRAAKTVSRIDLLIVFSLIYRSQSVLSGQPRPNLWPPPRVLLHSRMHTVNRGSPDAVWRLTNLKKHALLQHCDG
jgi:hypothetical protein